MSNIKLEVLDEITVLDTTVLSDDGTGTGSIVLEVAGGMSPFQNVWDNGDEGAAVDSLVAGLYTVTIHDSNGCSNVFTFEVPLETAAETKSGYSFDVVISPNPVAAGEGLNLRVISQDVLPIECSLWDVMGREQISIKSLDSLSKFRYLKFPGCS